MQLFLHEETADGDSCIDRQRQKDRVFGAEPFGQPAKQEGEREGHELNHQQRTDDGHIAELELFAVNRRHVNDGANAVVVQPEGEDEDHQLAVAAQVGKSSRQPFEAGSDRIFVDGFAGQDTPLGFAHVAQHRNAEHRPPYCHGDKADARHQGPVFNSQKIRQEHDHKQVDRQQQPAAQVSQSVAARRNAINFIRPGHMRQKRVVEDQRAGEPQAGEDVESGRQQVIAFTDEEQQAGAQHAQRHEDRQEAFFRSLVVRHGTQNGAENGHDQ